MLEDFKIFPNEGISQVKFGMRPSEDKKPNNYLYSINLWHVYLFTS
jgi:hypothetical protein